METYHKKSKIGRGNRFFRGLSKRTNHRFLQTRETVPLSPGKLAARWSSLVIFGGSPLFFCLGRLPACLILYLLLVFLFTLDGFLCLVGFLSVRRIRKDYFRIRLDFSGHSRSGSISGSGSK